MGSHDVCTRRRPKRGLPVGDWTSTSLTCALLLGRRSLLNFRFQKELAKKVNVTASATHHDVADTRTTVSGIRHDVVNTHTTAPDIQRNALKSAQDTLGQKRMASTTRALPVTE